MAFSTANPGMRNSRRGFRPVSEINVTPLVDVMLVLLIIFMVTAPLMTVGVPVDLPKTSASVMTENDEPLTVSINKKGEIYLQETALDLNTLIPRLQAITGSNPEVKIYVRGDKDISYGQIMDVMGTLSGAGFSKVALISEMPNSSSKKRKR